MKARLGLLGGMFDPVHIGHIQAANYALKLLKLDELRFIPCSTPNHRDRAAVSSEHRLNMLELTTEKYSTISVDPIEINRLGISYTVDTLSAVQKSHGPVQLVFVLGIDSFNTLLQWQNWKQLFKLCHLLILARPGVTMQPLVENLTHLSDRRVDSVKSLFSSRFGGIFFAEDFKQDVSSTRVREALRSNKDVSAVLDKRVLTYIKSNKMYQKL